MALPSDQEQLVTAWRALSSHARKPGWSIIEAARMRSCAVHAGRKFPGDEESLLIEIQGAILIAEEHLPRGQGFSVQLAEGLPGDGRRTWIALVKQAGADLPLFAFMAADVVALLREATHLQGSQLVTAVVERIRAWQEFMKRDRVSVLSYEEEIGLMGELLVVEDLMRSGVPASAALDAWVGPENGLHDLLVGNGAIEVKATTAGAGFLAEIGNLEQLDDSVRKPLYVACVRLAQDANGRTLPEHCDALVDSMGTGSAAARTLREKLLMAGYLEAHRSLYIRRFAFRDLGYRLVGPQTPRLTRATVPGAIHRARYVLDLDVIPEATKRFAEIADNLGVAKQWN